MISDKRLNDISYPSDKRESEIDLVNEIYFLS